MTPCPVTQASACAFSCVTGFSLSLEFVHFGSALLRRRRLVGQAGSLRADCGGPLGAALLALPLRLSQNALHSRRTANWAVLVGRQGGCQPPAGCHPAPQHWQNVQTPVTGFSLSSSACALTGLDVAHFTAAGRRNAQAEIPKRLLRSRAGHRKRWPTPRRFAAKARCVTRNDGQAEACVTGSR